MKCPFCGKSDTQVKDSRDTVDETAIRRRRECPDCGGRFTTYERVQLQDLIVIKKNGENQMEEFLLIEKSLQGRLVLLLVNVGYLLKILIN